MKLNILAIDGCKRTLNKVNEVKHKLPIAEIYLANIMLYIITELAGT